MSEKPILFFLFKWQTILLAKTRDKFKRWFWLLKVYGGTITELLFLICIVNEKKPRGFHFALSIEHQLWTTNWDQLTPTDWSTRTVRERSCKWIHKFDCIIYHRPLWSSHQRTWLLIKRSWGSNPTCVFRFFFLDVDENILQQKVRFWEK